jgi:hypothetical protein
MSPDTYSNSLYLIHLENSSGEAGHLSISHFTNQIVADITRLAEIFGETGGGRLSQKAWEDLQATRWAAGKLSMCLRDDYQS